ncbi:T9SS type A sorting domain-containing protein [Flavobacterium sp. XGLA_31]|uniref:T9SS type A sorting domain-containing protein n=1 Tax=Flavobacterium sp. XGLA_31 TaxID=3447666 RepID=UPI003F3EAC8D
MKTRIMIKNLRLGLLTVFLMMVSVAGYSQACTGNMATVTLQNFSQTSNTVEFDIYLANTGTNTMLLNGAAITVLHNAGVLPAGATGTVTCIQQPSVCDFPNYPAGTVQTYNATNRNIRYQGAANTAPTVALTSTPKKYCRMRFTSSLPWAQSTQAQFTINPVNLAPNFGSQVQVYCNGNITSTTLMTSTTPDATLTLGGPYTYPLNDIVCATAAAQTASTPVSCFGGTNGTSTITLSPVPTNSAITYTVDGGSSQNATLSSGAFTINGLTAGNHEVVITNSGCGNLSATGVTVGTPAQLTNSTTASACGSYTWSVNGQTYTASGTYTATNNSGACPVAETLHLTITPETSNTTTVTTCGSYTWSVNDVVYTETGIYTEVRDCHTEVLDLTIAPQAISTQPASTYICSAVGSTATYTVASNMSNATYQWQFRKVSATLPDPAWTDITTANAGLTYSGYNTNTLLVTRATTTLPAVGTQYRVIVTGACGAVTSDLATITIYSTAKGGTITAPASVCLGSDITFTLTKYAGTSFQWQSSPISTATAPGVFTDIPGATGTSYTIVGATAGMDRSYRVLVTNSCTNTTAYSPTKTIKVDPTSVAGNLTSGGGVVCAGSNGTLKVAGYVGKIQWQYSTDGENYVNAPKAADNQTVPFGTTSVSSTAATYLVTGISTELWFRARVTSGACSSSYTSAAHYTIGTAALAGTITPASTTLCPGNGTTLTLSGAVGVITWQKSTTWTAATPTWVSSTNHTDTFATGNLTVSTAYRAMVTIGSCSTVYSDLVFVYVVAKPLAKTIVANTTTPSGKTALTALCTNDASKILTVGAGSIGSVQWQWSTTSTTSGFTDIVGATGNSYVVTNPAVGANYFRVKMSNTCGVEVFGTAITVWYKDCTPAKAEVKAPFNVVAYPNPYTENFNLSLTTSSVDTVGVAIYDMTGKLIDQRTVRPSEVSDLQVGDRYPSGVYNVVVTQGSEVKTLRVIKR